MHDSNWTSWGGHETFTWGVFLFFLLLFGSTLWIFEQSKGGKKIEGTSGIIRYIKVLKGSELDSIWFWDTPYDYHHPFLIHMIYIIRRDNEISHDDDDDVNHAWWSEGRVSLTVAQNYINLFFCNLDLILAKSRPDDMKVMRRGGEEETSLGDAAQLTAYANRALNTASFALILLSVSGYIMMRRRMMIIVVMVVDDHHHEEESKREYRRWLSSCCLLILEHEIINLRIHTFKLFIFLLHVVHWRWWWLILRVRQSEEEKK